MSSPSPVQNGQTPTMWDTVKSYALPPFIAGVSIFPFNYFFVAKAQLQAGNPLPQFNLLEAVKGGAKTVPTVGAIVGIQLLAQQHILKGLNLMGMSEETHGMGCKALSSGIVGLLSVHPLAVLNGQFSGKSVKDSLRNLSFRQSMAIVTRETSFLFALTISQPVSVEMKKVFGDHQVVQMGSGFLTGFIGSVLGHPADTALTLWQKGKKIKHFSETFRGASMKGIGIGGFVVLNNELSKLTENKKT